MVRSLLNLAYWSNFARMQFFIPFLFTTCGLFSQTGGTLIYQDFNGYDGTSATVPPGWNFSYNGNYTSTTYSGASGPNSYRFGVTAAQVTSPAFQNADSVRFWIKGAGTDTISFLTLYESSDSIIWTPVTVINPIPLPATVVKFPLQNTSTHIRFIYTKSVGNMAMDDLEIFSTPDNPNGQIIVYFNSPVDTTVGFQPDATYLNQSIDDTLVAWINRSNFSLDIALYNFNPSGNIADIVTAINNAWNRGVAIRWIYNGSSTNTGLSMINPAIPRLISPTTSSYGLMHNKFMVIDAASPNTFDTWTWTGSLNWEDGNMNNDHNNVVLIKDRQMGLQYVREFSQMWGSYTALPDITISRFGPTKFDNNIHRYIINGRTVDLYFSPAQYTNNQILSCINSAGTDLYFGVYAFTMTQNASAIINRFNSGVYTAGILDQFSVPYDADDTLAPLGNMLKVYNQSSLYHNKFMFADFSDTLSDPLVLTGSHNWTNSAETKNDENTLIIHDPFIVNQYYQSFYADFIALGGQLGMWENAVSLQGIFYPNPNNGALHLMITSSTKIGIEVYDLKGALVYSTWVDTSLVELPAAIENGLYMVRVRSGDDLYYHKLLLIR